MSRLSDVIVTTMNDLPGYRITDVYGEVFGLTVRSRHIGSDIGASLKGLVGGEIKGYTKMLADSRLQAIERLRDAARETGSNAIIAMRFDCNELGEQHDRGRRLRHRGHGAARIAQSGPRPSAARSSDSPTSGSWPTAFRMFRSQTSRSSPRTGDSAVNRCSSRSKASLR